MSRLARARGFLRQALLPDGRPASGATLQTPQTPQGELK